MSNHSISFNTLHSKGLDSVFIPVPSVCLKCKGKPFVPNNSTATQKAVKENFGLPIPSECVTLSTGRTTCPFAPVNR